MALARSACGMDLKPELSPHPFYLTTPLSECIQHINFSKALKEIKKCPNISHGNNSLDDFLPKLQYASGTLIRKQAFMKGEDEVKVINPGRFLRLTAGDRCRLQI